jgi:hypothetical protein
LNRREKKGCKINDTREHFLIRDNLWREEKFINYCSVTRSDYFWCKGSGFWRNSQHCKTTWSLTVLFIVAC